MKKSDISILISSMRTNSGTRRPLSVRTPRVSPGALSLTKHPEDTEYDMHYRLVKRLFFMPILQWAEMTITEISFSF